MPCSVLISSPGKGHCQGHKRLCLHPNSSQTKDDIQRGRMCHFTLSPGTASEPKLPSSHPVTRSALLHLFFSAARAIAVSSTEAVPVTLADAIVLRHRISLHKACPPRDAFGRGDRKEGEGGKGGAFYQRREKEPSEIQNKRFLKHSSHPNRDTPLWQTSILMVVGFVVPTGNSPAPLCGFSEAPSSPRLSLLPFLQEQEELKWETPRHAASFNSPNK